MIPFGVDENGIIKTEVSTDKMKSAFRSIVDHIIEILARQFTHQLESVYLYGSVATGAAVEGQSDLDLILIFRSPLAEATREQVAALEKELSEKYQRTFRDVGLGSTSIGDVFSEKERYGGLCFLKHLSICLYGNDVTKDIPGYRPTIEIAKGFNGDIKMSLETVILKLQKSTSDSELRKLSQSVARKMIRTGFRLVMPRAQSWTADLQVSADTFAYYYPEKRAEIETALSWARGGHHDKKDVLDFVASFGTWLTHEFETEILSKK